MRQKERCAPNEHSGNGPLLGRCRQNHRPNEGKRQRAGIVLLVGATPGRPAGSVSGHRRLAIIFVGCRCLALTGPTTTSVTVSPAAVWPAPGRQRLQLLYSLLLLGWHWADTLLPLFLTFMAVHLLSFFTFTHHRSQPLVRLALQDPAKCKVLICTYRVLPPSECLI